MTIHNTKYAQPIIDKKMREVQENLPRQDTYQAVVSVADELSKLSKLKEQGILTEGEYLADEKQSNKRIKGLDYTMTRNSRFL